MQKFKFIRETLKNYPYFGFLLGALFLGGVSAVTSGIGAYNLLTNVTAKPAAIIIAIIFTIAVQSIILLLVFAFVRPLRLKVQFLMFLGLLVGWTLSILTAGGSYWFLIRAESYEQAVNVRSIETVTAPLINLQTSLIQVSGSLDKVAALATERAREEDDFGTSCGVKAPTGQGPRWRLRQRHKEEASGYSDYARKKVKRINAIVEQASGANIDANLLTQTYMSALQVMNDNEYAQIRSWATLTAGNFRTVFPGAGRNRTDLVCMDDEFARVLEESVQSIAKLPTLPATPPKETIVTVSQSILMSYKRAIMLIFSDDSEGKGYGNDLGDFATLLPAFLVEAFIFILAFTRSQLIGPTEAQVYPSHRIKYDPRYYKRDMPNANEIKRITGILEAGGTSLTNMLEKLLVTVGKTSYLLVPINGQDDKLEKMARRFVRARQLDIHSGLLPQPKNLRVDKLDPIIRNRLRDILPSGDGPNFVDLYKLSPSEIMLLNQALSNSISDEDGNGGGGTAGGSGTFKVIDGSRK